MVDFDPGYNQEKYRKAKFSEVDEDRHNIDYIAWDILFQDGFDLEEIHAKLNDICERVRGGDRNSMLELIELTADKLLVYDTLSLELRASLSDGLKEVSNVLKQSRGKKGFLPPIFSRGSGVLSEEKKQASEKLKIITAMRVEYYRWRGLTLEDSRELVEEVYGPKVESIRKHWNKFHKQVKPLFDAINTVNDIVGEATGIDIDPTRRKKRYGKQSKV